VFHLPGRVHYFEVQNAAMVTIMMPVLAVTLVRLARHLSAVFQNRLKMEIALDSNRLAASFLMPGDY
jgi:hypothetical protein